jgi:excinuclease UvrABC nuclease subunit
MFESLADFARLELPEGTDPAEALAGVPKGPGVFLLTTAADRFVQFGGVDHLQARLRYYLVRPAGKARDRLSARRADLSGVVGIVRYRATGSRFETRLESLRVARLAHPTDYRAVLKLEPAVFLRADLSEDFPRLLRTERPFAPGVGECAGPMPDRSSAGAFAATLAEIFELCGCRQARAGTPDHTACAAWQMGRCPLPADEPSHSAEYRRRAGLAMAFAAGGPTPWPAELEARMRSAAAGLRFEEAARLKARLELCGKASADPGAGLRGRADGFDRLIVEPAAAPGRWSAFCVRAGWIGRASEFDEPGAAAALDEALAWLGSPEATREALRQSEDLRTDHAALVAAHLLSAAAPTGIAVRPDAGATGSGLAGRLKKIQKKEGKNGK